MKLTHLLLILGTAFITTRLFQMGERTLVLIPITISAVYLSAVIRANRVK